MRLSIYASQDKILEYVLISILLFYQFQNHISDATAAPLDLEMQLLTQNMTSADIQLLQSS